MSRVRSPTTAPAGVMVAIIVVLLGFMIPMAAGAADSYSGYSRGLTAGDGGGVATKGLDSPAWSSHAVTTPRPARAEATAVFLGQIREVFATRATGAVDDLHPSPYQVHIDPHTGRGPMAIDTAGYKGTATSNGGVRNSRAFWDDWATKYPDTLSEANQARIAGPRPRSPQVDDQWVQHFPETGGSQGETLVHHHLDCGPMAIPLPQSVHGNTPGFGIWHAGC